MMDFTYEAMTEEAAQNARFKLMEEGSYKGVIEHVESKASSKGNPMLVVTLRVWDASGLPSELTDYIVSMPSMIWKLRHLCESAGLMKEFESQSFKPDMLVGKDVMVMVKTQQGKEIPYDKLNGKEPGSKYPTKNIVDDYIGLRKNTESGMKPLPEVKDDFHDDELPF